MPAKKRHKTDYPGVYYIEGKAAGGKRPEKIYYIMYRKDGKLIEEKAGRQYQDDMTPARASGVRIRRIEGKQLSNRAQRESDRLTIAFEAGKWTVHRLSGEYFSHRDDNKSTRTDKGRYNNYLKSPFSNKEPQNIIQLDVERLQRKLLKKLSPQTVKHILALLKRIINFGVDRGLCEATKFKITMPRVDNIKTEDLSHEQLQTLLDVLESTPHQTAACMMKLALFTGMRRGEIFKLQWNDVDFHRCFIHIRSPKGGKSQKIPINSNARMLLQVIPKQDSEYIFPARGGGPRKDINKDVNRIKTAAGLPKDFRPMHGLRHLYATMLASSGKVDLYTLQKLLTHKSPDMTQRYAHYRDDALRKAADQVDDILAEAMQVNDKVTVIK